MNEHAQIAIRHSTCPHDCPSACALDVEVVEGRSFHLLESLAACAAEAVLERFAVRRVRVRIAKQNLGWTTGGRAVIEVVRERRG